MERTDFSGVTTDAELVHLWLSSRPESTVRVYRPVAEIFLARIAPKGLRDLTVSDITDWRESLVGADTTKARFVSTVKSLLSFAWRTGYCSVNVGRILRCVKIVSRLHEKLLEEDQVRDLIGAASSKRDGILIRLLYIGGLRISEAIKLRFVDIGKGRVTVVGKGAKVRTIVVPDSIVDGLKSLRQPSDRPESLVFTSYRGRPLGVRDAREAVYKAAREAGLKLSPHHLRHTHATHALERGANLALIQRSLGHANLATTSVYLHVRPTAGSSQFLPEV
jgi:integrase/recombinase XerD